MNFGTPLTSVATKALLLGSGELGKEVALELQRYGVEVIACDKYANAPAMQVAHRCHVFNMLDGAKLRQVIETEQPSLIIPEVEAIATPTLVELEKEGYRVIPTANAAFLTMNREAIRRMAAEELGLPTARYKFADTHEEYLAAIEEIGIPCVVKPIMSSSGHGQSTVKSQADVEPAWTESQMGGRAGAGRVIVEGDHVIFSEVSPRPHDTGMVTMISQDLSEFALHARAVLGLPIPEVRFFGASASKAIVVEGDATEVVFSGVEEALAVPGVQVRFFGKPEVHGHRRYGVILATDANTEKAVEKAIEAFRKLKVTPGKLV